MHQVQNAQKKRRKPLYTRPLPSNVPPNCPNAVTQSILSVHQKYNSQRHPEKICEKFGGLRFHKKPGCVHKNVRAVVQVHHDAADIGVVGNVAEDHQRHRAKVVQQHVDEVGFFVVDEGKENQLPEKVRAVKEVKEVKKGGFREVKGFGVPL